MKNNDNMKNRDIKNNDNMKNRGSIIVKYLSFLMLVLLVWACSLEIEETDSITLGEGLLSVSKSVTTLYNDIQSQTEPQDNLYALTEVTTDEQLVPTRGTDWGDNGVWRQLHAHTWPTTHQYFVTVWNEKNGGVLKSTQIIEDDTSTPEQIASAKFARAYNMWILVDFFGQVPIRGANQNVTELPLVLSRTEAYDFVVKDLTEAIENLPNSNPQQSDKSRPVKATARFFLAKVKLNAHIYKGGDPVAADLDEVINLVNQIESDGYGLTGPGTYFDVFKLSNKEGDKAVRASTNVDVIWDAFSNVANRIWNSLHYSQYHPTNTGGGWNGFSTLAEFYDLFEGTSDTNVKGGNQEERKGFTQTLESTNKENWGFGFGFQIGQMYGRTDGDADNPTFGALKDRADAPLVFLKDFPGLTGNNERTGIRVLKYSPANGLPARGVVLARFADAYLMRAEAMLRKGDNSGALTKVNELRAMRENTPPLTALDEQELLDERGRELYLEGWRRNDLVRFGKFTKNWQFKDEGSVDDVNKNLFPIPSSALLSNPNLTQNPGY